MTQTNIDWESAFHQLEMMRATLGQLAISYNKQLEQGEVPEWLRMALVLQLTNAILSQKGDNSNGPRT